ncbi:Sat21 [Stachybotrys chartarum IBT 7711]|uniref:MFS transporter SAT21 n=1 Tax=Stachybotrys chartarum (strain CBS 109288 / IBT 7711) TaxID=1280523 RepID=SAT21_STACB|nr:RecName: Full=MFS transporter SAT21; AltName: Full=Satratoxin biosynthesis SC3 cluster protein 216 [Stachybotrys chartarum IBT 7711]KEY64049.1 Sat21 [Stachybotrys chartarum IBT 7711]
MLRNTHLVLPFILYLLFRLSHFLLEVPTVRMIELAACHQHLRLDHGPLNEAACKTPPVQEHVSLVVGWKMTFDSIPGLMSILYFGTLADKSGHRAILRLCCVGYLLAILWVLITCLFHQVFPVELVLLSSLFLFIGGGQLVFAAVITAFVADLFPPPSRTKFLFLLAAMPHMDKVASPALATKLMEQNLFLPSLVSMAIVVICVALLQMSDVGRETAASKVVGSTSDQTEPFLRSSSNSSQESGTAAPAIDPEQARGPFRQLKNIICWVHREPVLFICYLCFFLKSNAMASEAFIFQYLSEKFGWPLRETTVMRLALSSGAVISTLIICPLANATLHNRGVASARINIGAVHASSIVLVASFIMAWQASSSTAFIFSMLAAGFGEGLEPALQGVLAAASQTKAKGSIFALMCTCSLLGDMTGGPLMSALMSIGRGGNGVSDGYCFLASALVFGAVIVLAHLLWALGAEEMLGED